MKKTNIILTSLFVLWFTGLFIAFFLIPDRDFSDLENTQLSDMPEFNFDDLVSGEFGSDFEEYLNDQFPFRDFFIESSTAYKYSIMKREMNGAYFIGEKLVPYDKLSENDKVLDNIKAIEDIYALGDEYGFEVYTALYPDGGELYTQNIPYAPEGLNQKYIIDQTYSTLQNENCADIYGILQEHMDEDIFYSTDHHWTSTGAYYAYFAIMESMGIEPIPLSEYEKTVVNEDFYGTLHSKAPAFWINSEEIITYAPDNTKEILTFDGVEYSEVSLYNEEKLENKDKYAYFLGGNQPLIKITTENEDKPKLLILRDSYMDSVAPFLQSHFSEIHMLDVRYYRDDLKNYIEENEIDDVLVAYSVVQFANVMQIAYVMH